MRQQIDQLGEVGRSGARAVPADRLSAGLAYRRPGECAEAIATYEGLAREAREESVFRQVLADLQRNAGLGNEAEAVDPAKSSGTRRYHEPGPS